MSYTTQELTAVLQKYKSGKASLERRVIAAENWWKLRNRFEEQRRSGTAAGEDFRSVSGWLHNVIVSKHADAMEAYPEPLILPREPDDRGEAALLSAVLPCILEQNAFERTWSEAMWQKLKTGTAVYRVGWDSEKLGGLGDISIERVDLLNIFWEPGVSDIQRSKFVFCTHLEDNEELEEQFPQLRGRLRGSPFTATRFLYDDAVSLEGKSTVVEAYYRRKRGGRTVLHYVKYVGDTVLYSTEEEGDISAPQGAAPLRGSGAERRRGLRSGETASMEKTVCSADHSFPHWQSPDHGDPSVSLSLDSSPKRGAKGVDQDSPAPQGAAPLRGSGAERRRGLQSGETASMEKTARSADHSFPHWHSSDHGDPSVSLSLDSSPKRGAKGVDEEPLAPRFAAEVSERVSLAPQGAAPLRGSGAERRRGLQSGETASMEKTARSADNSFPHRQSLSHGDPSVSLSLDSSPKRGAKGGDAALSVSLALDSSPEGGAKYTPYSPTPAPAPGLYAHGRYPFVLDPLFPVEGSPCGYGFVDLCHNNQTAIDLMRSAIIKNTVVGATPRYFQRIDGSVNEEEFADLSRPLVHVSGNLGEDSLRQIGFSPLSGVYMDVLNSSIQELRETSGNTETSTGNISSGVTAASAIAALQEASGKGSRDATRSAYLAYAEIIELCIELIRQFYGLPRSFRIAGRSGAEEYIRFSNLGLGAREERCGAAPVFDVKVSAQKRSAYSRLSQNELAMELYRMGIFSDGHELEALSCLQMMEFDGRDELINRINAALGLRERLDELQKYKALALAFARRYRPDMAAGLLGEDAAPAASGEAVQQDVVAPESAPEPSAERLAHETAQRVPAPQLP